MKFVVLAAAAFACLTPAAVSAQTAPAATAPAAAAAPAAKFNLDTPIEVLVADPAAKAVLDADLGGDITKNEKYESGKTFSFNQVAGFMPQMFPPELLKKIETDLAAIK